jgi:arylformamidase
MKFIDLTHPMRSGQPSFPGTPAFTITHPITMEKDQCNLSHISISSHQGTHLDALRHFIPDGLGLDQMPLDWFCGPATVLRIPKKRMGDITVGDLKPFESKLVPDAKIILSTGWSQQYGQPGYFTEFPGLTLDTASYIASRRIRLLGMDMPAPGRELMEVHHILLGKPAQIVVVENLTNLDAVPDEFYLHAFPLRFENGDGSPIRAVAGCAE